MKVYQAQELWNNNWHTLPTQSGGTFCDTVRGAKAKLSRSKKAKYKTRILEYTLSEPVIIEEEYVD